MRISCAKIPIERTAQIQVNERNIKKKKNSNSRGLKMCMYNNRICMYKIDENDVDGQGLLISVATRNLLLQ